MQAESLQELAPPLQGVRVLDLTHHVCGSFAAKLLGDHGADVVKVERPGFGDLTRALGPFPGHRPDLHKSGMYLYLNANKRGITLNLKTEQGRGLVRRLAERSEIILTDFRPRDAAALGITPAAIGHPSAVMTAISNFGQTGPYRDFEAEEINIFGFGGSMRSTGTPDREPTTYTQYVALLQAGLAATLATAVAYFGLQMSGLGGQVDLAISEVLLGSWDRRVFSLQAFQYTGMLPAGRLHSHSMAFGVFPCADGYVTLAGQGDRFPRVLQMMGRDDLLEDPRFATPSARTLAENSIAFNVLLLEWLMQRSRMEIWMAGQEAGVLIGPVYAPGEVAADTHLRARGFWRDISDGELQYTVPGEPFILHGSPGGLWRHAPALGEHNHEVYCGELGIPAAEVEALQAEGVL